MPADIFKGPKQSATEVLGLSKKRLCVACLPAPPQTPKARVFLTGLSGLSEFVAKVEPELAANAMLCAVNQAAYLLRRRLESQGRAFLREGGFPESLYAARSSSRTSQQAAVPAGPVCPSCGKAMVRRVAKSGRRSGQAFWGCTAFPECRGTRPVPQSVFENSGARRCRFRPAAASPGFSSLLTSPIRCDWSSTQSRSIF